MIGEFSLDAFLITGNGRASIRWKGRSFIARISLPKRAEAVLHGKWDTQASMHVFNDGGWFTGQARPELLQAHVFSGFHYQPVRSKAYVGAACHQDLFLRRS